MAPSHFLATTIRLLAARPLGYKQEHTFTAVPCQLDKNPIPTANFLAVLAPSLGPAKFPVPRCSRASEGVLNVAGGTWDEKGLLE